MEQTAELSISTLFEICIFSHIQNDIRIFFIAYNLSLLYSYVAGMYYTEIPAVTH